MLLLSNNSRLISSIEDYHVFFVEDSNLNTDSFSFFNRLSFQKVNFKCPNGYFLISGDDILGLFLFHKEDSTYSSLYKSSYGGFEFLDHVSHQVQEEFVKVVLKDFFEHFLINQLKITLAPEVYHDSPFMKLVVQQFFKKSVVEISHYIDLNQNWREKIRFSPLQKIKKCVRNLFQFKKTSICDFDEIYRLIQDVRINKKYPVSMNSADLRRNINAFPNEYSLFCVKNLQGEIISGAVCIQISDKVAYLFYIGHDLSYNSFSPNSFLIFSLAEYYEQLGFSIFDIGVSSENGIRNEGLSYFKESLGCQVSEKNYFTLQKI